MTLAGNAAAAFAAFAIMVGATGAEAQSTKFMARQHLHMDDRSKSGQNVEDPNVPRPADVTKAWPQMTSAATAPQIAARFAAIQEDVIQRKANGLPSGLQLLGGGWYGTPPTIPPWQYAPNGFWYARDVLNEPYAFIEFPAGFPPGSFCEDWDRARNKPFSQKCESYHQNHISIYERPVF